MQLCVLVLMELYEGGWEDASYIAWVYCGF